MAIEKTPNRLATLESNTVGETSKGTTSIVQGWTVTTMPNGEKIATAELDYLENTDFTWDEQSITYLQENIPNTIFTTVNSCTCDILDYTPNTALKSSMNPPAIKELFSTTATSKVATYPIEYIFGNSSYSIPTKLHALWTVRGI